MLTKQNNMADQDLIVNSIKVLGDISGSGIQTIKTNVQNIQNSVQAMAAKQNDYFRSISDDGIITAAEKKTLKREWDTITQTYAAIIQMARDKQVYDTAEIQSYEAAYKNLYAEIFTIEKIFDDMYSNTNLLNKDLFNAAYDTYYSAETYAQNRISTGESFWQLRILNSLSEAGADNEVALYKGTFFRYNITSGIWEKINTSQYKGAMDHFPEATSIDDYFLSRGFSTGMKLNLKTPKETRSVEVLEGMFSDEEYRHILFNYEIKEGYLYIYSENGWEEISDRNDWRYAVAVNDLAFYGMELSPGLQQVLDNSVAKAQPEYLGPLVNPPQIYKTSDYFCWGGDDYNYQYGTRSIMLQKGRVYKFNGLEWFRLDPADSDNNTEFMAALNDIISLNMGSDAYFNNIFLRKIFALEGVIQELSTKIITLQKQGKIVSEEYQKDTKGVMMDAAGSLQLDNATIIQDGTDAWAIRTAGFTEASNKGMGIKKNGEMYAQDCHIKNLDAASGTFSGILNSEVLDNVYITIPSKTLTYEKNSHITEIKTRKNLLYNGYVMGPVTGRYGNINFSYIEVSVGVITSTSLGSGTGYCNLNTGAVTVDNVVTLPSNFAFYGEIRLYNSNKELIQAINHEGRLPEKITITIPEQKGNFLKVKNIPVGKPTIPGIIYIEDGYLSIS